VSGRWRDSVPFAMLVVFVILLVIPAGVVFLGWLVGGYVGIIVAAFVLVVPFGFLNA
jgi:hypothetical protein